MQKNRRFGIVCALAAAACMPALADWTWLANPVSAYWLGDANWDQGVWDTSATNNVVLGASTQTDLSLTGEVAVARLLLNANASYAIHGGRLNVKSFYLNSNASLMLDTEIRDEATSATDRLGVNGASSAGTLTFKGAASRTNEMTILAANAGTVRFDGGETHITGSDTTGSWDKVPYIQASADTYVEGGARVVFTGKPSYINMVAGDLVVTDGVFDAWNVGTYRNGWGDNNSGIKGSRSRTILKGNGTLLTPQYLIGKARPTETWYNADTYAKTILSTGGTLVVRQFMMDNKGSGVCCGSIDFDGGTLVVTNSSANSIRPTVTGADENWTNVTLNVLAGGVHIHQPQSSLYATYKTPFVSNGGPDGGITFTGNGFCYVEGNNTCTGGTHLAGNLAYIPLATNAFGALAPEPRDDLFIDPSPYTPTVHMGSNLTIPANHDVSIAQDKTLRLGVQGNVTARIAGVIHGPGEDGHASTLNMCNSWQGCAEIGPENDRTNLIGRLQVYGHLRHVAGTTLVTSNATGKTGSATSFFICGNNQSYSTWQGVMEITGGMVKVPKKLWVDISQCGQLYITNGTFDVSATSELLNGLDGPGRIVVSNGGQLLCNRLRISQNNWRTTDGVPMSEVRLNKGGLIRTRDFWMDVKSGSYQYRWSLLRLDGGTLQASANSQTFFGEYDDQYKRTAWGDQAWVVVEAGGAVIDTQEYSILIYPPLRSGTENDGGLTKKGTGVLTLSGTNTYNGVTRVEGGQVLFAHAQGFPGGTVEIPAAALKAWTSTSKPFVKAVNFALAEGKAVRITEADTLDVETWHNMRPTLVKTDNAVTAVPRLELQDSDGTVHTAQGKWQLEWVANGTELCFKRQCGTALILR